MGTGSLKVGIFNLHETFFHDMENRPELLWYKITTNGHYRKKGLNVFEG